MSRFDDLIHALCPNGVEFQMLGDISELVRGNGMPKKDLVDEGVGAIHYGQIYTRYGVWATETLSFVTPVTAAKLAKADPGDIIITNTSENIDDVGKAVAWLGDKQIVTGGHATIIKHRQNPKFLSYWFASIAFSVQKRRLASGTKVVDVSAKQLAKVQVPVPPLQVQAEIVQLLDAYSRLVEELEGELKVELELRREQLGHYRRQVLADTASYRQVGLTDVADFFNAKAHERLIDPDGSIALLTARFISTDGRLARYVQPEDVLTPALEGDVALVMSDLPNGRALARTFYVDHDGKYAANQRVCLLRSHDHNVLMPRYLFHTLNRHPQLLAYNNGMDQTHLKKGAIQGVQLGLPPVEEQRRIVAVLDELEASASELTVAVLPAEVALRRKQYDYYRDSLLTFKERAA